MSITLDELIKDLDDLVSLPGVFTRINQMVDDPNCSITEMGEVISQDPGLTTRLLRMANSAMYGLRTEIDTVSKAVTVIGVQKLRDLVLATAAVDAFDGIPNEIITMEDFWMHSLYCALISKQLSDQLKLPQSDTLFVAGLLHDLGHLVMFKRIPEASKKILIHSMEEAELPDLYLAEQKLIGFDHAMVGSKLAEHWHFPQILTDTIRYHHQPEDAPQNNKQVAIIHIANTLAVLAELNTFDIEETDAPAIHPQAWQVTGLTEAIIPEVVTSAREQYSDMRTSLFLK